MHSIIIMLSTFSFDVTIACVVQKYEIVTISRLLTND